MGEWIASFDKFMVSYLIPVGWKVIGNCPLIVGSWVIKLIGTFREEE